MRLPLAACCALLCLSLTSPAAAWTRTSVESVNAHLDVDADGDALVLLEVGLRVRGGWLSHLELAGLGDGVVLDADKPPWLIDEDGGKYVPDALVHDDGRIEISFANRRQAPWRGDYKLGLLYRVPLAHENAPGRASWTLPAWRVDMHNVVVRLDGPAGLRLLDSGAENLEVETTSRGERSSLRVTRAQLPRTVRWRLELGLPPGRPAQAAGEAVSSNAARSLPPFSAPHLLVGTLLALLAWLKRGLTRMEADRRGSRAVPLIWAGPPALAAALTLGAGIAAGWLHARQPLLALGLMLLSAALGMTRSFRRHPGAHGAPTRPVAAIDFQRARRTRLRRLLGGQAWLDGTSPAGLLLLVTMGALAWRMASHTEASTIWLEGWLAALPLFFNATRRGLPSSGSDVLLQLRQLELRLQPVAASAGARLQLRVDTRPTQDRDLQPALQVSDLRCVPGMRGLQVTRGLGSWQGRERCRLMWLAIADTGSIADGRLARALPRAQVSTNDDGTLTARSVPVADGTRELAALLEWLEASGAAQPCVPAAA